MSVDMADRLRGVIAAAGWDHTPATDPADADDWLALLRPLHAVGRIDLPLGRLLEGHVDAVQIVLRYGTARQADRLRGLLRDGAMLGVWNAALAGEALRIADDRLFGGKSYASGAGILSHALVTVDMPGGPQLLLLDLGLTPALIERGWWDMTGMQRSESHIVRWDGVPIAPDDRIGMVGDYPREPFFSGGALRFVAVHAGGVAGLCDLARDHLVGAGRADDPFQAGRLAELFGLAETAAAMVRTVAGGWFSRPAEAPAAHVAAARLTVTAAAERAIIVAREAVGLSAMFVGHPLAAMLADLAVYLRQPAPDAQRLMVGRAVAGGVLTPML